ncbi:uncharacterized protein LOC111121004 [Crassostrea virginica]|uniref:Uncharacterized protein LOC111121004 n=1 Tax=Crassostrea virginica TaxID=6565 RepID=A0A8B8CRH1_CRAVI|nr:uncharacterized protein LOC111121004 [Crassostrea virginica]
MAYCGSASKWAKIGLVFQYIGLALFLSGFGTIGWMVTQTVQDKTDITVGLFRMIDCSSGSCATSSVDDQYQNSGRDPTLGMMIVVLIVAVPITVMYSIYVGTEAARSKCLALIVIISAFVSALFAVIGMIIYAVLLPTDFYTSYSLGLITLAAGLFATAGCLLIPDVRNNVYKTTKTSVTPPPPSPSLPPIESPPPRYRERTPEYYTPSPRPQKKRGYWEYKEYETPRPTERRTPRDVVRVHLRSTTPLSVGNFSTTSSPRRYGTPPTVQRYDHRAR